jgi:hypothetical protein
MDVHLRAAAGGVSVVLLVALVGCDNKPSPASSPRESTAFPAQPPEASDDLNQRVIERRAVEVAIWGMPAVSMAAVRASLRRDLGADFGDVIYFSKVMEPRHEFLTANNQTPYVLTFFDLRQGPMVLEVPAATDKVALFGSGIDSWEVPLVDVGPTGDDAGKGGKYLLRPPGADATPPQGYFVVDSPTVFVHFALRPITTASSTLQDAVDYSQRLKTYRLNAAGNPPATRYVDAYPNVWKTLPTFDVEDFRLLADTIEVDPPQAKDAVMLAMLASIGIEKGKPFAPDAARAELLTRAARQARAEMNDYFMNRALDLFWPDRRWLSSSHEKTFGFSYYGDGKLDYDRRAGGFAFWATWAPKRLGDPGKLPASYYLENFRDSSGALFNGDRLYRLRVPADTPARDFWSIVAYEVGTNAFIHNPENRVGVSSYDKDQINANEDGSVDVYVGPQAPQGFEGNWIPTAGRDFWLVARFYGPEKPLFDRSWKMPDVEEVK